MVLGILTAVAACPAIIGTTEAVRQGQRNNAKERHRGQKANLIVSCSGKSKHAAQVNGGTVVLRNNKLFIDVTADEDLEFNKPSGHPFSGYFLPHPEHNWRWKGEGMVSTIMDDPPQLNWIYVDEDTNEVKYGTKVEANGHVVGPWNCTKVDRRIIFEGWEGFLAVKEGPDTWALYFDRDDDALKDKVSDKRMLEIELIKKERKKTKESADDKDYI
ncbi:hypothetical protein MMC27_008515 [Xylographa pallens]|nr:hypothetical protein [Xylographa pallens]